MAMHETVQRYVQTPKEDGPQLLPPDKSFDESPCARTVGQALDENPSAIPDDKQFEMEALESLQMKKYEQVLKENTTLHKKVRLLSDELTVTNAKKDGFKVQAQRFREENFQLSQLKEVSSQQMEDCRSNFDEMQANYSEMVRHVNEMRTTHIQEVRMLQKAIDNRGAHNSNVVNQQADVVSRLGTCVMERDELAGDAQKLRDRLFTAKQEARTFQSDNARLKAQMRIL